LGEDAPALSLSALDGLVDHRDGEHDGDDARREAREERASLRGHHGSLRVVDAGGLDVLVPEPERDRGDVDVLGSEEHRVGVAERVWGNAVVVE
jgi:hypothetical protein